MHKLIFLFPFLSFLHIQCMDLPEKSRLIDEKLNHPVFMILTGNHEAAKELERSPTPVKTVQAHEEYIHFIAYNPHNPHEIASGSQDKTVRIWDLVSGKCVRTLPHDGWVIRIAYHPDNKNELISATLTGTLYRWNLETAESHKIQFDECIHSIVYNPYDSNEIAVGLGLHGYAIYNVKGNTCRRFNKHNKDGNAIVAYNPHDEGELIVERSVPLGYLTYIDIWDHQKGTRIDNNNMCHPNFIRALAWDPHNSDEFASGSADKTISIWSKAQKKCLKQLPHEKEVRWLAYNPYVKNELASGSFNKVHIWDISLGQTIWEYELEKDDCVSTVIYNSRNKDELALASGKGLIRVWKRNAMQQWFSALKNNVLPVESFMQKDSAGNERRVTVDPKVLLVLMHKLDVAFKNQDKGERAVLTPQELAYLSNVIFENGADARQAVGDLVAVEKRVAEKEKKKKIIKKVIRKKKVHHA